LATSENEADLILLDLRFFFQIKNTKLSILKKPIIVDYTNNYDNFFEQPCLVYFRSFINLKNQIVNSSLNCIPIQYALWQCYVEEYKKKVYQEQDIDKSILFDKDEKYAQCKNRIRTLEFLISHSK